jgi:PST family polysaccharide transporter
MGFIILAKGHRRAFVGSDMAFAVVHVALALAFVRLFGLAGAGMAFFGAYVFFTTLVYVLVHQMSGFRWTAANRRLGALFLAVVLLVTGANLLLPPPIALAVCTVVLVVTGLYSVRALVRLVPWDRLPGPLKWVLRHARLAPAP